MPPHHTFVTQLLQIYHGGIASGTKPIDLPAVDQVKYLCNVGLGPIAFQVYGDDFKQSNPAIFSVLQSADLTTRVIYSQLEKATVELVTELSAAGVIPTFLKGISASYELYTPHYLRVMGDIDILIKNSEVELVMARVAELGYEVTDAQWRMNRTPGHHLPAARHPRTGVTIEVHTGLFASAEFYAGEYVFQPSIIDEQCIEFDYKGNRAARFTPEFQFIYTISKWSVDRDWVLNLKNINDTILILGKYERQFDWPKLSSWFAASPHLFPITYALMHYLEQADIITVSPQLREMLNCADCTLGSRKLQALAWLMHTYPFNARDKVYSPYTRWCAHAMWLYLTKPSGSELGITGTIWFEFCQSALYGQYSPVRKLMSGLRLLSHRIKGD